jgi:2-oxoisovalerate dehydrogenase E2 component (dihydrolipoyl transacylase)
VNYWLCIELIQKKMIARIIVGSSRRLSDSEIYARIYELTLEKLIRPIELLFEYSENVGFQLTREFKLPDLGEGVAEGEIVKWLVNEGDPIKEDQPMVEVMTDKATVQIPSPTTGKVGRIMTKEGQTVKVGDILVTFDGESESTEPQRKDTNSPTASSSGVPQKIDPIKITGIGVAATPATRKLARDLNVSLETILGSGPGGRITEDDIRKASKGSNQNTIISDRPILQPTTEQSQTPFVGTQSISTSYTASAQSKNGGEEHFPIHGIRKRVAEKMSRSVHTAATVTHIDEVDFTQLIALREKAKPFAESQNVKLTFLPFIMKAAVSSLKEFPYFNSSIDDDKQEIIVKHYYNIGFAADTPNGLIVPVVKSVDKKSIFEIARELGDLSEKARVGKIALDEIQGGTFTITNIGTLGGMISTPIINSPEVAILGVHKIQKKPVVRNDQIVIRDISFVSLSFDHRIVDGADAARFTTKLISILENPGLLMMDGVTFS